MALNLIPQPLSVNETGGRPFILDETVRVVAAADAADAAWLWHDAVRAGLGIALPVVDSASGDAPAISLVLDGDRPEDDTVDAEAYRLVVAADGIRITAAHPTGLVRGVYTLRQLLPAWAWRTAPVRSGPVSIDPVEITDTPRFRWRGVMLDVARHFKPKAFVLRLIDLAAAHRFNVVHLHLTDDQGWRIEVPSWPKLTEIGSWRTETVVGHAHAPKGYDGTPHGGYYTVDDLREIVAYAAARHITVVPEIDLPGHVRSVLAAYPELGNTAEHKPVATTFGIFPEILAPTDEALRFSKDVFDTVAEIFPSQYIHIGGDEVPRTEWRASQAAVDKAAELGLEHVDRLQSWFTRRFAEQLAAHGRKMIGWDEILDGGAPDDATIMVWREFGIAAKAMAKGHPVVVAPVEALYLNYYESDGADEPLEISHHVPLSKVAGFDPIPEGADADLVVGVQAQLWSEYHPHEADVEYSAFPRLAAVADLAWSTPDNRRRFPVVDRIDGHVHRLDAYGVNRRPADGPLPWQRGGTGARARYDVDYSEHEEPADLPGM